MDLATGGHLRPRGNEHRPVLQMTVASAVIVVFMAWCILMSIIWCLIFGHAIYSWFKIS